MAQHMEEKGTAWLPSLAHPPRCPQQTPWPLSPVPPAAGCPQCLGGAGKETQVQTLLGAWSEHSVMREDAAPDPPFAGNILCQACNSLSQRTGMYVRHAVYRVLHTALSDL